MGSVIDTFGQVAIVGGAIVAVGGVARLVWGGMRASRRLADLHDLANLHLRSKAERQMSNPADHREGMVDRQQRVEDDVAEVRATVDRELHPNGSKSIHDRVRVVEGYVKELKEREQRGDRHVREARPAPIAPDPLQD